MRATFSAAICILSLLGNFVGVAQAQKPVRTQASQSRALQETTLSSKATTSEPEAVSPVLWVESGVGYRPSAEGLLPHLRIGLRGIQPLTDTVAIYAAFAIDGDLTLDMGGWYSFLPGEGDLFGFRSYAGTGLSYVAGSFGVALSAALSYELSTETSLVIVYTHRPLLLPELSQAFDVSLGVSFTAP